MEQEKKSRLMFLDIDDTLLVWVNKVPGFAAPMADKFLFWALEHFEVRWLTCWCPCGFLQNDQAEELSYRFNNTVSPEVFLSIKNNKKFWGDKTAAIDFDDPRPWVWVEDGILSEERALLTSKGFIDNFYHTDVTNNMVLLQATWRKIAKRFNLPQPPMPYDKNPLVPENKLSQDEILEKYRKPIGLWAEEL